MRQEASEWAELEFRGTPGLETRLQARLVRTAAALLTRPHGTLPQRFGWAELKAAYRLVDRVPSADALQDVHRHRTRERMHAVRTPVLVLHDTTQLDFTSHPAVADQLGPIGNSNASARGFLQHNSLAVDPERGELLGLVHQQTVLRVPKPDGETSSARRRRADKESQLWARGMAAVGRPPAGRVWVHVGDRGADVFGAMEGGRRPRHQCPGSRCNSARMSGISWGPRPMIRW